MLVIVKCLKCGSTAEPSSGGVKALCLGGCPEAFVSKDNFEVYSIEGNIIEWINWVRGKDYQGEES